MNHNWIGLDQHIKKIKPMGPTSPHVWSFEPVFGCNLACGHCCAKLIKKDAHEYMTEAVWRAAWEILGKVSPTVRVDICGFVGEPTLHPQLTEWLKIARKLAPFAQIQITTNGTMLLAGKINYKSLFEAGLNIAYTDQYGSHRRFEELAEASGYPYYQYYDPPEGAPTPWKYYGPRFKCIVLMDPPFRWPKSRYRAGLLGNWYGNLDWKAGEKFGMKPLEQPIARRCNQPYLYVSVAASGNYLLCCQDGLHKSEGRFGNVLDGVPGFQNFWYGKEMQLVRRRLRYKNRADTDYACAKCNITFSRCDFRHWSEQQTSHYWDGEKVVPLPHDPGLKRFDQPTPKQTLAPISQPVGVPVEEISAAAI